MSWSTLDPDEQAFIASVLTAKQLDIYILRLAGCSHRRIATMRGYRSKGTVSDHLAAADNALAQARKEAA